MLGVNENSSCLTSLSPFVLRVFLSFLVGEGGGRRFLIQLAGFKLSQWVTSNRPENPALFNLHLILCIVSVDGENCRFTCLLELWQ